MLAPLRTVTGGSKSTTGAEVWHVPSFCVVREDTMAQGGRVGLWAPPLTNPGPSVAVSWRLHDRVGRNRRETAVHIITQSSQFAPKVKHPTS